MLVKNQYVEVNIINSNKKHYIDLGYDIKKNGIYLVAVEHLPIGSHTKVNVICDYCGKLINIEYREYLKHKNETITFDCCFDCCHEKSKQANKIKYGVNNVFELDEFQNKAKSTMLERYGVESYLSTSDVKLKSKETCIAKYGVDHHSRSEVIKNKTNLTLIKNGNVPTSSQQIELHKIIQEQYPNAILNYPFGNCIFDIALIMSDNVKIDIEYDCWYWHRNKKELDKRRDYYSMRRGWKVLRIKSAMKLPDESQLFEKIKYLINTQHHHSEIILDDWREVS
jgi:hypothetical protein